MKNINIIKNNYQFQKIIGEKKSIKTPQYFVYFKKSDDYFHYGISVGKKLGNAVIRNKVKRQVRMMIKSFLSEVKDKTIQIIIIVRSLYFNFPFELNKNKLKEQILSIMSKK